LIDKRGKAELGGNYGKRVLSGERARESARERGGDRQVGERQREREKEKDRAKTDKERERAANTHACAANTFRHHITAEVIRPSKQGRHAVEERRAQDVEGPVW
jgi:hypothetical protein